MAYDVPITEEQFHDPTSAADWKESFYFQLYDPETKLAAFFYISAYPNIPKRDYLVAFLADGETDIYLNTLPTPGKLNSLGDGKLTFELAQPHELWKIRFDDGKRYANLEFTGRFDPFAYDPKQAYKKGILEQEHYEQGCFVDGTIHLADGTQHQISCFGHRDHSWGLRDYAAIDEWNWIAAQFSWCTINLIKLKIGRKHEMAGFLSNLVENQKLTDITFKTVFESDNLTPREFTVHFTDIRKKKWQLDSTKLQTMIYPPRQSKPGHETTIYEIVSQFTLKDDPGIGYGISEFLISRKTSK